MANFELHPKLAQDCHFLGVIQGSQILLMDDARFPWMILVPEIPNTTELHKLPDQAFASLTYLVRETSEVLKRITEADKINVAALGNQVPQLHVHVVARFSSDDAWPQPVWGLDGKRPYEKKTLRQLEEKITEELFTG